MKPEPNDQAGIANVTATYSVASYGAAERRMFKTLQLIHDLLGGTETMREARERWLPKEPGETLQAYNNRLGRSTFFNALKHTVKSLVGRPFSKLIQYSDSIPAQIQELFGDVDLNGTHLDLFIREFFTKGLEDGLVHLYVDMPVKPPDEVTMGDSIKLARRPYFVLLDARRIIAHQMEVQNGRPTLTQVRWREDVQVKVEQWGEKEMVQIRVVEPGVWETWRPVDGADEDIESNPSMWNDPENWERKDLGVYDLKRIPLFTFYAQRESFMEGVPPLKDLAWENVAHWQSKSDQSNILKVARLPLLFGKLLSNVNESGEKVQLVLGPNTIVFGEDKDADMKWVEIQGGSIEAGRKDLEDIENRMAIMGTELLVRKVRGGGAPQTATQVALDNEIEYSDLAMQTRTCEDTIDNGIRQMAEWMNIVIPVDPGEKLVTINKDFGISLRDAADLQILLQMRVAGQITQERFLTECQRRGLLDPALDISDEVELTRTEGPPVTDGDAAAGRDAAAEAAAAAAAGAGGQEGTGPQRTAN